MLAELAVSNLGIIKDMTLQFDNHMTALTGETGAGKTLITEAVSLLLGGRADPVLVGPWAEEAEVEGRFVLASDMTASDMTDMTLAKVEEDTYELANEIIIRRVIARKGRSRAYINTKLAATKSLAEVAGHLVDLHGQHLHQSLLRPVAQRAALDSFGKIDITPLREVRSHIKELKSKLNTLGGDEQARQRTLDMLHHQLDEISAARLSDPNEDEQLQTDEKLLSEAAESQSAVQQAAYITGGDGPATCLLYTSPSLRD